MATALSFLVPLGVLVLAAALVALGWRLARTGGRRLLSAIGWGAWVVAIVAAASGLLTVPAILLAESLTVSFPVSAPFAPPPGVTFLAGPDAAVTFGEIERASARVSGLSALPRVLLLGAEVVTAALVVTLAVTVANLATRLERGEPFAHGMTRAMTVSALAVFVGGGLAPLLRQLGEWRVAVEALEVSGWSSSVGVDDLTAAGWPEPALVLQVEWWPALVAVALAALALAFRTGERLQRDTEGLV